MHASVVLSLPAGIRTAEARALHWAHADLDGDPGFRRVITGGQWAFVVPA